MPSRIYGRNPLSDAWRRIPREKLKKLGRAVLKKAIRWMNPRREKKEISVLCSRLQIPPEKVPELFGRHREARSVIAELQEMLEMAEHAGLGPEQTKQIFQKARTIEQARAYLTQLAEAA